VRPLRGIDRPGYGYTIQTDDREVIESAILSNAQASAGEGFSMNVSDFRELALGFDDAEEGSHGGAADFRVGGHIFATLAHEQLGYGNLMLSPELQQLLIAEAPEVFLPVAGGWGRQGITHIRLAEAIPEQLLKGLQLAWNLRVQKNGKSRTKGRPIPKGASKVGDWREDTLARMQALIVEADPEMTEERKWKKPSNPAGVPTWSHNGLVCTGETYKDKVKLTFAKGASIPDPSGLFNSSLEGNARRAIDIREGEEIDSDAFKALVVAAVAKNAK
jgi:hypothetical protein